MLCHFPLLVARFMLNSRYIYVYIILYMKTIRSIGNTVSHHAHSHSHTEKQLQQNGIETENTSVELSYGGLLYFLFLKEQEMNGKKPRIHQKISVWIKKSTPDKFTHTIRLRIQHIDSVYHRTWWHNVQKQTCQRKEYTNYIVDRLTEKSAVNTMLTHRMNWEQRLKRRRAKKRKVIKVNETWKQKRNVLIREPKKRTYTHNKRDSNESNLNWSSYTPRLQQKNHIHLLEMELSNCSRQKKECHTAFAIEFILLSLCTHFELAY